MISPKPCTNSPALQNLFFVITAVRRSTYRSFTLGNSLGEEGHQPLAGYPVVLVVGREFMYSTQTYFRHHRWDAGKDNFAHPPSAAAVGDGQQVLC